MAEQAVRDRLEDLIRRSGEDYASLSRRIGRNPAYIQQFIKRGVPRRLNEYDRRALARHLNVPESFLGAPDARPPAGEAVSSPGDEPPLVLRADAARPGSAADAPPNVAAPAPEPAAHHRPGDFLLVPFLDRHEPSPEPWEAGEPTPDQPPARALAVELGAARQMAVGRVAALRAMRIDSDSMLPTLAGGDEVLIDCDDRLRLRDGIYVILSEGAPMVKRISVHPVTKRLSIISDNPAYPSFADCDPDLVRVIGRVVWAARRLA
jgi:hypothetical protein